MCKIGTAISKEKYIERVLNTIKNENLPYEYIGMDNTFIGVKTKIKLYCKAHDYYFEIKLNNFFCGKRCAKCNHSFQCEGDFRFYCHWREDCYCIGDWADCSGYQPKGE